MALTMRPTGLGRRLQGEHRLRRVQRRFYWSVHGIVLTRPTGIHTDGAAATLKAAKAEFRKSWNAWKAWAKLDEVA